MAEASFAFAFFFSSHEDIWADASMNGTTELLWIWIFLLFLLFYIYTSQPRRRIFLGYHIHTTEQKSRTP